jgi:selenocysteine lyase/cysteine desulfurase
MFERMRAIPGMHVLADNIEDRLPVFSFYIEHLHFNLIVRLLNDRYGIQARGGCSCAGTYGHYLLHVDREHSRRITNKIDHGDLSAKPGWVRLSLHPTTTDDEVELIAYALNAIARHGREWEADYEYSSQNNEYYHTTGLEYAADLARSWFAAELRQG